MPRNPEKTRCQVPGCRNYAIRGRTHCRSHSDAELGPRGAGAPPGNLNAVRTGRDAHPLSRDDLDQLVHSILSDPDQLPHHLDVAIQSLHDRAGDPVKTLVALQALVPDLVNRVADGLFIERLRALVHQLPPSRRKGAELSVWRQALLLGPIAKLELLNQLQANLPSPEPPPAGRHESPTPVVESKQQNVPGKQLPGASA
jgi:hypothetical protein